jgi:hypothetical protein
VKQMVCRRLEALEKFAAAERARKTSTVSPAMQSLLGMVDAWAVDSRLEQLLAETPPDVHRIQVQELREELMARAYGNYGVAAA